MLCRVTTSNEWTIVVLLILLGNAMEGNQVQGMDNCGLGDIARFDARLDLMISKQF